MFSHRFTIRLHFLCHFPTIWVILLPKMITDFLFLDILELLALVSWLICFSVELGVKFFSGGMSWFCRVTSFPLSRSLFSIFSWLFDVLVGSTSCEISFWLLLLLLMLVSESFSLFLSPMSSVLLLFYIMIIFSGPVFITMEQSAAVPRISARIIL